MAVTNKEAIKKSTSTAAGILKSITSAVIEGKSFTHILCLVIYQKNSVSVNHLFLFQRVDPELLWCHEEDGGQHASIDFCYWDGEDQQPGEHTGIAVHQSQDRVTQ